jgi:voltage-gated potassium channel
MVAAIIEGDLGSAFGERRMKALIDRMSEHYVICGFGRVGEEIARELKERGVPFVVVDRSEEAKERAQKSGHRVILGDATTDSALLEAGIERCRALIAATDSDASNTYITLTARSLRKDAYVVARVSKVEVESKLRQAGASRIVSPYAIGGRRLAFAAIQPNMADFFNFETVGKDEDRIVAEFVVEAESSLAGKELGEVFASCHDAVVLAVRDASGRLSVGPPSSRTVSSGDKLIVVGDEDDLRTVGIVT